MPTPRQAQTAEFDEFAVVMWPSFLRAGALMGAGRQDAEDAAQDALVKCFKDWRRVAGAREPRAYAVRIFQNCLRATRRKKSNSEQPAWPLEKMSATRELADVSLDLRSALKRLSQDHRDILVLRYYLDLTEQQTADALQLSIGTVKSRQHRAKAELERHLGEHAASVREEER